MYPKKTKMAGHLDVKLKICVTRDFLSKSSPTVTYILNINLAFLLVTDSAKQCRLLVTTRTIPIVSLGIGLTLALTAPLSKFHLK